MSAILSYEQYNFCVQFEGYQAAAPDHTPSGLGLVSRKGRDAHVTRASTDKNTDRKVRESALESLRTYLKSSRDFPELELLKLHKALFFAMWHQDRAVPQQNLATSLGDVSLSLTRKLFVPYMRAFWQTMAREWTNIDALRMDKFLRLSRVQTWAGFEWLRRQKWSEEAVAEYMSMISTWPLSLPTDNEKVGDGLRYHVLDVWVDELERVDGEDRAAPLEEVMASAEALVKKANTKALRSRAKECTHDERLEGWREGSVERGKEKDEADFDGFDDD